MIKDPRAKTGWPRLWAVMAITALLWMLAARILGPTDGWNQTQPLTIGYTTDIGPPSPNGLTMW